MEHSDTNLGMRKLLAVGLLLLCFKAAAVQIDFKQANTNHFTTNGPTAGTWQLSIRTNLFAGGATNGVNGTNGLNGVNGTNGVAGAAGTNSTRGVLIFSVSQGTNFWLDKARTNSIGERALYQSYPGTNNIHLFGVTNFIVGDVLSFNIVASNANRTITVPTNFAALSHMRTQTWDLSGTMWLKTLTNSRLFRGSVRTNEDGSLEFTWQTPEQ